MWVADAPRFHATRLAMAAEHHVKNLYLCPGAEGHRAEKGRDTHGECQPGGGEGGQER